MNDESILSKVSRKTTLQEHPLYYLNQKRYLIEGDKFVVKEVSGDWLNIEYKIAKARIIKGWIVCADTSLCRMSDGE